MRLLGWAVFSLLGLSSVAHAGNWGESWGSMVWGAVAAVPSLGLAGGVLLVLLLVGLSWWRKPGRAGALLGLLLAFGLAPVSEAQVSVPNTFVNGTLADADQVNANFDAVEAAVNDNDARVSSVEGDAATNGANIASETVRAAFAESAKRIGSSKALFGSGKRHHVK